MNLRKLKSLKGSPLLAVGKDFADSQDTGIKWIRNFVCGRFKDESR